MLMLPLAARLDPGVGDAEFGYLILVRIAASQISVFDFAADGLRGWLVAGLHPLPSSTMAQFRAKRLDLGCFVNIKNIRDHTKRKVFEQHEPERYAEDND